MANQQPDWSQHLMDDYSVAPYDEATFAAQGSLPDPMGPWVPGQDGLSDVGGYLIPFDTEVAVPSPYQSFADPPMQPTEAVQPARETAIPHDLSVYGYGGDVAGSMPPPPRPAPRVDVQNVSWTYVVEVWPVCDLSPGRDEVTRHIKSVQEALEKRKIQYALNIAFPTGDRSGGACRRYTLHRRYRDHERVRLDFLQVFSANRNYNLILRGYRFKMSVVSYDPKQFVPHSSSYPNVGGGSGGTASDIEIVQSQTAPFSPSALNPLIDELDTYNAGHDSVHHLSSSPASVQSFLGPLTPPEHLASVSPSPTATTSSKHGPRSKPIAKPDRGEVPKNAAGMYECTYPNCTEPVRVFGRKCEWNKHMDKHDRPYRCPAQGCEKLPGFTYAGGLLRHQREVHGHHGGPKNPLNCPHDNCKRHAGRGFTRLENLNEHLRRVHTGTVGQSLPASGPDDLEDESNATASSSTVKRAGGKRKADDEDLQQEVKRLRDENHGLREQVEAQKRQQIAMMEQMAQMQRIIHSRSNADQSHASPSTLSLFDTHNTHQGF